MEFERYWKCLDVNNQSFMYCRAEEEPLTQCALQKLVGELMSGLMCQNHCNCYSHGCRD